MAEREVAFKRLVVARDKLHLGLRLFEREYETLASLSHPRIVEVYDFGIDELGPYYTMEFLDGDDLSIVSPLGLQASCRVARDVASALALLHARKLVHRDVSPRNVRLARDGRTKLLDFGGLSSFGLAHELVGTPGFIAPEALRGSALDARSDLYSLGAVLYGLVTGRPAIRAQTPEEQLSAIESGDEIVPPSYYMPELPGALDGLLRTLLSPDPLARPENAAHVIDQLTVLASLEEDEDERALAYSFVARPPLVGRGEACDRIATQLRHALECRGSTLALEGMQGEGRTALLDQVSREAQLTGALVLRARGARHAAPVAVGRALVAAAMRLLPGLEQSLTVRHPSMLAFCSTTADKRGRAGLEAVPTPTSAAERFADLLAAMRDAILAVSERCALVIAVDDVHLADVESLGLLVALADAAKDHALLLVTASHTDEPWSEEQARARLFERAQMLRLSPLTQQDVGELVRDLFGVVPNSTTLAQFLYVQAAGNPQRTMELVFLLLDRELIRYRRGLFNLPRDPAIAIAPGDLTRSSSTRLEGLSPEARRVVEVLSIARGGVPLEVLSRALSMRTPEVLRACEELRLRALVRGSDQQLELASAALRASAVELESEESRRSVQLRLGQALLADDSVTDEQRVHAGYLLMRGGETAAGADAVADAISRLAQAAEGLVNFIPEIELALAVWRTQGRSDAACIRLLGPLAVAGFYGDPRLTFRYFESTYRALLYLSGTELAQKLRPRLGARLSLVLGFATAYVRFRLTPAEVRLDRFPDVLTALLGTASAGAAAMTCAYEPEHTVSVAERLRPFAGLPPQSAPRVVRELCLALSAIMTADQSEVSSRSRDLMERLRGRQQARGLPERVRAQIYFGAIYVHGISEVYSGNPEVLGLADTLEQSGRAFAQPRAELLRMCHHAFRGEQARADHHRKQAEVLALLGGTLWSAMSAMAIRLLVANHWSRDTLALRGIIGDLQDLRALAPALDEYRALAEAYLDLLHGHAEQALATYERILDKPRNHPLVTWPIETAHWAEALNRLGRHVEALELCRAGLARAHGPDRRMYFLYLPLEQELALANAHLGHADQAGRELEALIEQTRALNNPLLTGALHRDRCRVAMIARDRDAFELHLAGAKECFRATSNSALVGQCEILAREGTERGLLRERLLRAQPLMTHVTVVSQIGDTVITSRPAPKASE